MKIYDFYVGGSAGKGDSWDYDYPVELTDEEAERLEASAKKMEERDMDQDPDIADIYEKVYKEAYENELENVSEEFIEEERDEFLDDEDNWGGPEFSPEINCWIKKAVPITDRELAARYLDNLSFTIGYPRKFWDPFYEEGT